MTAPPRHTGAPPNYGMPRGVDSAPEIREQVYAALGQLTPEDRAVIVLKEIEDLQYCGIAEILNVSIGTVMSRLFYARKKLQSVLRPIFTPV
jgi:RNA polymerase sigma-70 factor (ECF subfamily)